MHKLRDWLPNTRRKYKWRSTLTKMLKNCEELLKIQCKQNFWKVHPDQYRETKSFVLTTDKNLTYSLRSESCISTYFFSTISLKVKWNSTFSIIYRKSNLQSFSRTSPLIVMPKLKNFRVLSYFYRLLLGSRVGFYLNFDNFCSSDFLDDQNRDWSGA